MFACLLTKMRWLRNISRDVFEKHGGLYYELKYRVNPNQPKNKIEEINFALILNIQPMLFGFLLGIQERLRTPKRSVLHQEDLF
jgi:hypothetical protein